MDKVYPGNISAGHTDSIISLSLPKTVRQLAWRPYVEEQGKNDFELAVAGDDSSLRIYGIVLKMVEERRGGP